MAVRTTITNKGLQLLASSSQATGQYYWLGYYALAYVPDFWKTDTTIDFPDPDCFQVNTGTSIEPGDIDPVTPTMQRLTTYGDMIWNIWQGDLTGTGFIDESDGTPGGNLFGLTMYGTNVKKHYRYLLDENGNNLLVCWINDPTSTTGEMQKQTVYYGTDGFVQSELPIPAPLYYLGDVTGKIATTNFFPDFSDSDENGSSIYPFIEVDTNSSGIITIPKVSTDFRGYLDPLGNGVSAPYAPVTPGAKFDSTEIAGPNADLQLEVTAWYAANLTYTIPESTTTLNNNPAKFDTEFWKLHTSSNYNRWHAPVDNIGFILDSDLANRNMAKTTKFFPISNYKTINTEAGFTTSGESLEVATAIQLTIDLDLSPTTINDGSETSQITFFDKYENADTDPALSPKDQFGNSVYNTTHTSIKFNRIGIYAVPLRKHPCVQDQGFGSVPPTTSSCSNVSGSAVELQFQINPDDEPVLFAVMDWDNTVMLDDSGNGISSFHAEVNVNLESPDGVEDTALIRDCTIFYNLYEDDALKWYQNQLIANAQTQNAITELGLEVQSIINKGDEGNCCPTPDLSNLYALKNHTHNNLGLRNLKDAGLATENGLRGIVTLTEGTILDGAAYKLGYQAVALGYETAAAGNNSTVAGGVQNIILTNGSGAFIGAGNQNQINSPYAAIVAGQSNIILDTAADSIIIGGSTNTISGAIYSVIGGGNLNLITSNTGNVASFIAGGRGNTLDDTIDGFIGTGQGNTIYLTQDGSIVSGTNNYIETSIGYNGHRSSISAGNGNIIRTTDSFIGAGRFNKIEFSQSYNSGIVAGLSNHITSGNGFIGAGENNYIRTGTHASIMGGFENLIDEDTIFNSPNYSSIVTGYQNNILGSVDAIIGGGRLNVIERASERSGILSGQSNLIIVSEDSIIGSGDNNTIGASANSGIFSGQSNYINAGNYSGILSGKSNSIDDNSSGEVYYSVIAGGYSNSILSSGADNTNNYIFIGGGNSNSVTESTYSSIVGGSNNSINADFATVIGGQTTVVNMYGEVAHGAPIIGNTTVQHSSIMMRNRFNGISTGKLYFDGIAGNEVFTIPTSGGSISGIIQVAAYCDFDNGVDPVFPIVYHSNYIFTATYSTLGGVSYDIALTTNNRNNNILDVNTNGGVAPPDAFATVTNQVSNTYNSTELVTGVTLSTAGLASNQFAVNVDIGTNYISLGLTVDVHALFDGIIYYKP